ncbi:MAG: hypothetical protein WBX25_32645, partial [Rhodomicrobium sp.]
AQSSQMPAQAPPRPGRLQTRLRLIGAVIALAPLAKSDLEAAEWQILAHTAVPEAREGTECYPFLLGHQPV